MPQSICILTQSHLCRNPRVLKEAITLAKAGYQVHILTNNFSAELHQQDNAAISQYPNIRLQIVSDLSKINFSSFTDKLINKFARLLNKHLGLETSLSLGYGALRYYDKAKSIKADLYICHQELATYIGTKLLEAGHKVGFDLEDWYSEDLLPQARQSRAVHLLKKAEQIALNKGTFCITTSQAMAQKLSETYSSPRPGVIYNVFPSPDISKTSTAFSRPLKLCWFSQTIGEGRGLEPFIRLLNNLNNPIELHLLGNINADYKGTLIRLMPKQHHLYFHEIVPAHQLPEKIAAFDMGLALELDTPISRNYTITNKFFQYIQSGLPVVVSKTSGQAEAFEKFKPGFMLSQKPGKTEISRLYAWLNDPVALQTAQAKAIEASKVYNWENESEKLLTIIKNTLEKQSKSAN